MTGIASIATIIRVSPSDRDLFYADEVLRFAFLDVRRLTTYIVQHRQIGSVKRASERVPTRPSRETLQGPLFPDRPTFASGLARARMCFSPPGGVMWGESRATRAKRNARSGPSTGNDSIQSCGREQSGYAIDER